MEINLSIKWKNRIMKILRDMILIFAMWSIGLSNSYVSIPFYQYTINAFQIVIIAITILYEEYNDAIVTALEAELITLKKR